MEKKLSKVVCRPTYVMDNLWFQKTTVTHLQYINVQQPLVVIFEFTGAARGFMIMSCAARGAKRLDSTDIMYK